MFASAPNSHVPDLLERELFHIGTLSVSALAMLKVSLFVGILWLLAGVIRRRVVARLMAGKADEGTQYATSRIAGYAVWIVGILMGLPLLGIELSSLLVAFGALGVGVGLGMQNITENFVSGLILLFERPVKVGDRIHVDNYTGSVIAIQARVTQIRTNDNDIILVPNAHLVSSAVQNLTHNDRTVRYSFRVGVSYGSDPNQVREILQKVAEDNRNILNEPKADVIFLEFGDSALIFELRAFTARMLTVPEKLTSEINFAIWEAFQEAGIQIPFPQRDLHIKSVDPSIRVGGGPLRPAVGA